jgi:SH3-like domain-containing protein
MPAISPVNPIRSAADAIRPCLVAGLAALLLAAVAPGAIGHAGESGLPIPRWVSVRASEVNLRTGPGTSYPVEWVYHRKQMPVEIIDEFQAWRKIRDWEGTVGWVHQSMLDGRRTALVVGGEHILHNAPEEDSRPVAKVEDGVVGRLMACSSNWCELEADGYSGWLKRGQFWGAYPGEVWR